MTRAYRIIARIKNNRLWETILRTWPDVVTQSEAARKLKVTPGQLGNLLNMTKHPCHRRTNEWSPLAQKIATILRDTPEYLFDATLYGIKPNTISLAIDRPALEAHGLLALPARPDEIIEQVERNKVLQDALSMLTPREETVIRLRFGLDDGHEISLENVGVQLGLTRERIRGIEAKALRKLRHPSRHTREAL